MSGARALRLLLVSVLSASCSSKPEAVTLRLRLPSELSGSAKALEIVPPGAEVTRAAAPGVVAIELKRATGRIQLVLPGACPLLLDTREAAPDQVIERRLQPLFELGPSERVVGLGQSFELRAEPLCPEAEGLRTSFVVSGGAALDAVRLDEHGRALAAKTRLTPPAKPRAVGIVAVSAHEAQQLRTEIGFRIELSGGQRWERTLGISSVARSSGLPNIAVDHPVLLAGNSWELLSKPDGSQAGLRPAGVLSELLPDVPGRYRLQGQGGRLLSIQSGRYDQTPLDCGRADCHLEIAQSAQGSPMTQALASDLGGCHALTNPSCASACHATGEPGTSDGGFSHVMSQLELTALPAEHEDLPRALRRLGGVGCMACHGPTKIPEPDARFGITQNAVCAVCHDAPPRYGHVMALEASRMGHSDRAPETRRQPCARCHTSWGALGRSPPPDSVETGGVSCSTCHDVHPHGQGAESPSVAAKTLSHPGLLRNLPVPAWLTPAPASFLGVSRVCISCHSPEGSASFPEASAAALVAGQGGLVPATGAALTLASPHAASVKGCLSCHVSGPEELRLGKSHAFRATESACSGCHASPLPRDPTLAARARGLFARLRPPAAASPDGRPPHARAQALPRSPALARALRNVLLVLEDPAADVHHPRYAKLLLDAAETGAPP